jgi:hypothetical protein
MSTGHEPVRTESAEADWSPLEAIVAQFVDAWRQRAWPALDDSLTLVLPAIGWTRASAPQGVAGRSPRRPAARCARSSPQAIRRRRR